jgi:hypothetical protein
VTSDTLSTVFAHVASRLATTDYHRWTRTERVANKTSRYGPIGEQKRIHPQISGVYEKIAILVLPLVEVVALAYCLYAPELDIQ